MGGCRGFCADFVFMLFVSLQKNMGVRISPYFSVPSSRTLDGNGDKPYLGKLRHKKGCLAGENCGVSETNGAILSFLFSLGRSPTAVGGHSWEKY